MKQQYEELVVHKNTDGIPRLLLSLLLVVAHLSRIVISRSEGF